LEDRLVERDHPVENFDGDGLRNHLHPDLGFTREDRRINNRRTAYIAKLFNRRNIPVIVGMITPFRDAQRQARGIIESEGEFVLVHVKCSVEEAARRDPKRLYEQARRGDIDNFTGINHPFQEPLNPEIVVNAEEKSVDAAVEHVVDSLEDQGVLDEIPDEDYQVTITREEEREILARLEKMGHL
jgi:adenylylsulfate kinase